MMPSIIILADEMPLIMAPATLIAALLLILLGIAGIRILKSESQKLAGLVLFIIFIWAIIIRIVLY
jgi:hypothetical protein